MMDDQPPLLTVLCSVGGGGRGGDGCSRQRRYIHIPLGFVPTTRLKEWHGRGVAEDCYIHSDDCAGHVAPLAMDRPCFGPHPAAAARDDRLCNCD
jgi:hypothetical protein